MALSTDDTPELTRDQVAAMLTEPLTRFSTFLEAGPTFFDTDGNPGRVPKRFTRATGGILGEDWVGVNELLQEGHPDLAAAVTVLADRKKAIKTLTRCRDEV